MLIVAHYWEASFGAKGKAPLSIFSNGPLSLRSNEVTWYNENIGPRQYRTIPGIFFQHSLSYCLGQLLSSLNLFSHP